MEIEKKYLLEEPPGDLHAHPSVPIEQGYLIVTDAEELRIRKKGGSFILTLKKGSGTIREEVEIEIAEEEYRQFAGHTTGDIIKKRRIDYPHGGHKLEIDIYQGGLEGLAVAEVEFSSEREMGGFTAPDWLGEDVSEREEFKNKYLALKGFPESLLLRWKKGTRPAWHYSQSGIVPVRVSEKGFEVMLITTRKSGRWIIPKGIIEPDLKPEDSAAKEAHEEAGVAGDVIESVMEAYTYRKWNGVCNVQVFPMLVTGEAAHWPEEGIRDRKWVRQEDVGRYIENPELTEAIARILGKLPPGVA